MKTNQEIRLEVLILALQDMNMKFIEKLNCLKISDERGIPKLPSLDLVDQHSPKIGDILQRAEELYSFVSEK